MTNVSADQSPWILRPRPNDAARVRLFTFPYAGVGGSIFRSWAALLPPDVELCLVQLPGRDSRWKEPAFSQMTELLPALLGGMRRYLDRPFAFYGHSLGALISFELARALRHSGLAGPVHLFVAAHRAPQCPNPHPPLGHLADDPFVEQIGRRYGGIPQAVLENPELLALMLPCLRADLTLFESYQYTEQPPLSCPIAVFGGLSDSLVAREALKPWSAQTTGSSQVRTFSGGHFFLQDSRAAVLTSVVDALAPFRRSSRIETTT